MRGIVLQRDKRTGLMGSRCWILCLLLSGIGLVSTGSRIEANCWASFTIPVGPQTANYTGTYNVILGNVFTDRGYVTDASIWIGGTKTIEVSNSDPSKTSLPVIVLWDSTHFSDSAVIEIRIQGHNNFGELGRTYRPIQDRIYNKYAAFFNHEFESNTPTFTTVLNALEFMMLWRTFASQQGWSWQNMYDSVKVDTVLYFSTHGSFS